MNLTTGESGGLLDPAAITPPPASGKSEPLQPPRPLPERPPVIIEPSGSWVPMRLGDLWAYRELLYFLTWRDVKVRYKQTMLGAAWAILQPVFAMLIFTLLATRARIDSENIPYPIFAYAGLLPWTYFANAVTNSGNSLVNSSNLITKVYFPRMLIPLGSVAAGLVDFAIGALVLLILMVYYRVTPTWHLVMVLPLVVLLTALATAVGLWMSGINVKYRDIRHVLPFFIQLWMFTSPVIYPSSMMAPRWRTVLMFNPVTGIIDNFRAALFGGPFHWVALGVSAALTLFCLIYAAYAFRRTEKNFADII